MERPSEGGFADQSLPANDTCGLKRKDAPDAGAEDEVATKLGDGRARIDIYGNFIPAKAVELVACKNCGRQVQAGVFAPHLEKCMGKGRAAARAASRRLQQMAYSE